MQCKSMAEKIGIKPWRVMTCGGKRLKEGIAKFRQALEEDEKERRERGSGLPSDWGNRIFKAV